MAVVFKLGDNIDTDQLAPSDYVLEKDPLKIASHCLERLRPELASTIGRGDVLVAGRNFGCGSSRERAAVAVKYLGVSCVVAHSFARLFFRNAINIGLPILESPEAAERLGEGDTIEVDLVAGVIHRPADGARFQATALPDFVADIVAKGGLLPYARTRLQAKSGGSAS